MLLLGGPLGSALSSIHEPIQLLPALHPFVLPKYPEQARYLIGLIAALLLAVGTPLLAGRRPRVAPGVRRALAVVAQLAGLAFVGICLWKQHTVAYGATYGFSAPAYPQGFIQPYFTTRTLLVGAGLAVAIVVAVKKGLAARSSFSDPPRGIVAIGILGAVGMTAMWVLAGINLEHTILNAGPYSSYNEGLPLDEVFAVLDGRSPLVNFTPQYSALWPYPIALIMSLVGPSFGSFSATMCTITGISLLAVFGVIRRITRNALTALLFYLPFLATSLFAAEPDLLNRAGPLTLYSIFPLRYAGPYILLWLLTRDIEGRRSHMRWMIFTVAGLVLLNNVEFGLPAFGATFAAAFLLASPLNLNRILALVRDVAIGLIVTFALVSILTLLRAGSLPDLGEVLFYPRIYGGSQFGLLPTKTLGLHVVIYLTYVAAIALAVVRTIRRDPGPLLTGTLAWSGVFGLGIGSYFMGRSHPEVLVSMFSAWALSVTLLAIAAVKQMTSDPSRRVTLAQFAALFAIGVAACSVAQTPAPWTQIQRLKRNGSPIYRASARLKQALLRYGGHRPEAIMSIAGHRLAYEMGIANVSPYDGITVTFTAGQVETLFHRLKAAGGRLLVLPYGETTADIYQAACTAGFSYLGLLSITYGPTQSITLWSPPVPGVAPKPCPIG